MEDKRKTDAHSANPRNQTVVPKNRPSAIVRAAYFLAHFSSALHPTSYISWTARPRSFRACICRCAEGGGGNRRIMKLKVILSCAVFALMLVVLVIEIAERLPGPPSNCTTAQPFREAGHFAYNPCAILDPEQVVFVRN